MHHQPWSRDLIAPAAPAAEEGVFKRKLSSFSGLVDY